MSEVLKELLVYPIGLVLLELVFLLVQRIIKRWRDSAVEKKDAVLDKVLQALEVGVEGAWEDLGKAYKEKAKDRKLTAEEKARLRSLAIDVANEQLKPAGLDVLKVVGLRLAKNLIKRIVERRKIEGVDVSEASKALRAAIGGTAPDA